MEYTLIPCPFCGGEGHMLHGAINKNLSSVICKSCAVETRVCETPEEAARVWNSRANPDSDKQKEETPKLTSEQIIQALETCGGVCHVRECDECDYSQDDKGCLAMLQAKDLINRQQAEIEEVKCSNNALRGIKTFLTAEKEDELNELKESNENLREALRNLLEQYKTLNADAVTEFAEKLKQKKQTVTVQGLIGRREVKVIELSDIDKVAAEMGEARNGNQ